MFNLDPEVSFKGSPTVSPVTETMCVTGSLAWSGPSSPAKMWTMTVLAKSLSSPKVQQ